MRRKPDVSIEANHNGEGKNPFCVEFEAKLGRQQIPLILFEVLLFGSGPEPH